MGENLTISNVSNLARESTGDVLLCVLLLIYPINQRTQRST